MSTERYRPTMRRAYYIPARVVSSTEDDRRAPAARYDRGDPDISYLEVNMYRNSPSSHEVLKQVQQKVRSMQFIVQKYCVG